MGRSLAAFSGAQELRISGRPTWALAAPSYAMSSSTSTPDEAAFLEWFTSQGGSVHPAVGFKQWEGQGRGCVALQDIEPDTVLFSIPRSILLTTSTSALPSLLPAEEGPNSADGLP